MTERQRDVWWLSCKPYDGAWAKDRHSGPEWENLLWNMDAKEPDAALILLLMSPCSPSLLPSVPFFPPSLLTSFPSVPLWLRPCKRVLRQAAALQQHQQMQQQMQQLQEMQEQMHQVQAQMRHGWESVLSLRDWAQQLEEKQ